MRTILLVLIISVFALPTMAAGSDPSLVNPGNENEGTSEASTIAHKCHGCGKKTQNQEELMNSRYRDIAAVCNEGKFECSKATPAGFNKKSN